MTKMATLALTLGFANLTQAAPVVHFYNWSDYIGETTLSDFQQKTGIKTVYDVFDSNETLEGKLLTGRTGYDLVVPSNNFLAKQIKAGVYQELDKSKLPNWKNLDPALLKAVGDASDKDNKHAFPYMWGTIGIGYRKSKVSETPTSWKVAFDSDQYAGRIALLSEATTMIGLALKYLGYSYNSVDPAELAAAEALLIKQKKNIKTFAEDNGQDLVLAEEVDICVEWNGDMLQVMAEDDDLAYVVPDEGGYLWQDTLAIPTGAPHPLNAHAFLDFLMLPEVAAANAEFIQFGTPNAAGRALTSPEYRDNPAIFPPAEILAKSEVGLYQGEERVRLLNDAWTRILAA